MNREKSYSYSSKFLNHLFSFVSFSYLIIVEFYILSKLLAIVFVLIPINIITLRALHESDHSIYDFL